MILSIPATFFCFSGNASYLGPSLSFYSFYSDWALFEKKTNVLFKVLRAREGDERESVHFEPEIRKGERVCLVFFLFFLLFFPL